MRRLGWTIAAGLLLIAIVRVVGSSAAPEQRATSIGSAVAPTTRPIDAPPVRAAPGARFEPIVLDEPSVELELQALGPLPAISAEPDP